MRRIVGFIFVLVSVTHLLAQSDKPVQPDLPGDFVIDVGLNSLYNADLLKVDRWRSKSFGVYYMYTHKLHDFFTVNPMLGVTVDKYSFQDNVNFIQQDDRTYAFDTISDIGVDKSQLNVVYLELPLEIRFYPLKTIEGEGLFVGVGGMAGLRIKSYTKFKYQSGGDRRVDKFQSTFGLEDFRYGIQARIGYKAVNVFFKYYLSEMFRNGPADTNPQTFTLGLNLTGF